MKKVFIYMIGIATSLNCFSQSPYYFITGKVIDAATKQPMQSASVFAQNTTMGTVTDAAGNFKLELPNGGYDMVVTFTGYETESRRISAADANDSNIVIEMKQQDKSLEVVAVVASNEVKDGWKKYGSFFTDNFIGKTSFSNNCKILNPEALKFYFSKKRNRLKVKTTDEPLQIENDALGYKIKCSLDSFTYSYETQAALYTGYPFFEEMQPKDAAQKATWDANRIQAYNGSILHFMRSVYNKTLKEQGFEIQFLAKIPDAGGDTALVLKNFYAALNYNKDDSSNTVDILPNQLQVAVIYNKAAPSADYLAQATDDAPKKFQLSILSIAPKQTITIEENGYYYDQNDITVSGYWSWKKMADMLPYDYVPVINN